MVVTTYIPEVYSHSSGLCKYVQFSQFHSFHSFTVFTVFCVYINLNELLFCWLNVFIPILIDVTLACSLFSVSLSSSFWFWFLWLHVFVIDSFCLLCFSSPLSWLIWHPLTSFSLKFYFLNLCIWVRGMGPNPALVIKWIVVFFVHFISKTVHSL